ncbi:hypothetical protein LJR260_001613 [Variovorax paradoxus]|uniref:hypothetical protein n=1 Tax=Variovorax paradoxus TaxID=34073 RepID=UPI003ED02A77
MSNRNGNCRAFGARIQCARYSFASFIAHTEASTDSELPRFIEDEFHAFLECGIPAHGFLTLRCGLAQHRTPGGLHLLPGSSALRSVVQFATRSQSR